MSVRSSGRVSVRSCPVLSGMLSGLVRHQGRARLQHLFRVYPLPIVYQCLRKNEAGAAPPPTARFAVQPRRAVADTCYPTRAESVQGLAGPSYGGTIGG